MDDGVKCEALTPPAAVELLCVWSPVMVVVVVVLLTCLSTHTEQRASQNNANDLIRRMPLLGCSEMPHPS